jgi:ribonuclease J
MSALASISLDQHPDVSVGPGDTVVLSARAIPGNERTVSRLISNLYRRGCHVLHPGNARVHVSGHGSQEDLLTLLRLARPRYLVPVHGEYRMLAQHRRLAVEAGLPESSVLVAEDGEVLCFDGRSARKEGQVPAGRRLLDGPGEVGDDVVRERRHLARAGMVVAVVFLDRETGRLEKAPRLVARGALDPGTEEAILSDAEQELVQEMEALTREERRDLAQARERVRLCLRRFFKRRAERRPLVVPLVMEV